MMAIWRAGAGRNSASPRAHDAHHHAAHRFRTADGYVGEMKGVLATGARLHARRHRARRARRRTWRAGDSPLRGTGSLSRGDGARRRGGSGRGRRPRRARGGKRGTIARRARQRDSVARDAASLARDASLRLRSPRRPRSTAAMSSRPPRRTGDGHATRRARVAVHDPQFGAHLKRAPGRRSRRRGDHHDRPLWQPRDEPRRATWRRYRGGSPPGADSSHVCGCATRRIVALHRVERTGRRSRCATSSAGGPRALGGQSRRTESCYGDSTRTAWTPRLLHRRRAGPLFGDDAAEIDRALEGIHARRFRDAARMRARHP